MASTTKFEDKIDALKALIEKLENGSMSLEQSLKAYEHGMSILGELQSVLETADQKIRTLDFEDEPKAAQEEFVKSDRNRSSTAKEQD